MKREVKRHSAPAGGDNPVTREEGTLVYPRHGIPAIRFLVAATHLVDSYHIATIVHGDGLASVYRL